MTELNNERQRERIRYKKKPSKLLQFDKQNWYIVTGFIGLGGFLLFQAVCLILEVYAS